MIVKLKNFIKRILPMPLVGWYHLILAWGGALRYGFPGNRMTVIGVTGTNGKTTVSYYLAKMLELCGMKSGLTSTAVFKVAEREWLNDKKMTMLGRFQTQRLMADMKRAGCDYAVIETSSEGIKQNRHRAISFDMAVFTNLTPEHLEAHGGFERYRAAKGAFFASLAGGRRKQGIRKTAVINGDDPYAAYFLSFDADYKVVYGMRGTAVALAGMGELEAENIRPLAGGSAFEVCGVTFTMRMPGTHNVYNALAAVAAVNALGFSLEECAKALSAINGVPGRTELIDEGQDFTFLVDYAPEPASLEKLYEVVSNMPHNRVVHVLGSCGGGRDADRRPKLGAMAARNAEMVVVTNEDPYDDDPREIITAVANGARSAGKIDGVTLFIEPDRGRAIVRAVTLARAGDLVLLTGKGCEQAICVAGGKKIPWDDREEARRALRAAGWGGRGMV